MSKYAVDTRMVAMTNAGAKKLLWNVQVSVFVGMWGDVHKTAFTIYQLTFLNLDIFETYIVFT